jgi:hypothetical protein
MLFQLVPAGSIATRKDPDTVRTRMQSPSSGCFANNAVAAAPLGETGATPKVLRLLHVEAPRAGRI